MPTRKKQEPDQAQDEPSAPETEPEPAAEPEVTLSHEEQERLRRWLREKFH